MDEIRAVRSMRQKMYTAINSSRNISTYYGYDWEHYVFKRINLSKLCYPDDMMDGNFDSEKLNEIIKSAILAFF